MVSNALFCIFGIEQVLINTKPHLSRGQCDSCCYGALADILVIVFHSIKKKSSSQPDGDNVEFLVKIP